MSFRLSVGVANGSITVKGTSANQPERLHRQIHLVVNLVQAESAANRLFFLETAAAAACSALFRWCCTLKRMWWSV